MHSTEAKLAEIWCDVLGIPEVERLDNFFTVGGDSLLVAKVVRHLRRTWPIAITVQDVIESPVLAEFATWIDQRTAQVPERSQE